MTISDKLLMDLANDLGIESIKEAERRAEQFVGKSDETLMREIVQLKERIKNDPEVFERQMKAIYAMRPMMTEKQKARLDQIIRLLES